MAYSMSFGVSVSGGGISGQNQTVVVTGDGLDTRSVTVEVGEDKLVESVINLSRVQGYYIVSDQNVKLETNTPVGTGTAGDTINLIANQPISWYQGCQYTPHFSSNVASFYMSNSGVKTANLTIVVLKDATP